MSESESETQQQAGESKWGNPTDWEPRSRGVRDALALNRAAQALYEHEAERDGLTLAWAQVAQDGWEQTARKVIDAYEGRSDDS